MKIPLPRNLYIGSIDGWNTFVATIRSLSKKIFLTAECRNKAVDRVDSHQPGEIEGLIQKSAS